MKKYLRIYRQIFLCHVQSALAYRLNFVFKLLYGPAYILVLYLVLQTAFLRTNTLGGWTKEEATVLFFVITTIGTTCNLLFIDSIRRLLWHGIRLGEVDSSLLKPVSAQFLLTFGKANVDQIGLWLGTGLLFLYYSWSYWLQLTLNDLGLFLLTFLLAHVLIYLSLSTYATVGFYVVRAQQIMEFFDKTMDFAQYPITVFPASLQFIFFTVLPIAFFGYIPAQFLLGKGSVTAALGMIILTIVFTIVNQLAWNTALKQYSSASS